MSNFIYIVIFYLSVYNFWYVKYKEAISFDLQKISEQDGPPQQGDLGNQSSPAKINFVNQNSNEKQNYPCLFFNFHALNFKQICNKFQINWQDYCTLLGCARSSLRRWLSVWGQGASRSFRLTQRLNDLMIFSSLEDPERYPKSVKKSEIIYWFFESLSYFSFFSTLFS